MKIIKSVLVIMGVVLTVFSSCSPDLNLEVKETVVEVTDPGIQSLNIPDGFEFSTKKEITVTINDNASYVKYEVFAYSDDKYLVGTETFENQEGDVVTEDVYKNETNRLIATTILEDYGVLLSEAEDGAIAVKKISQDRIDLVLMDIQMPELNGYEATKLIREKLKSQIPIVALTANAIKGENEKCFQAGMDGYLSKPFTEEGLLQIVCEWLDKSEVPESVIAFKQDYIPLYNLSKLEDIAKGNQQFIDKMVQLFIDQIPDSVAEIKTTYMAGDYQKTKKVAHRIKPSIDIMGIVSLKNEIRDIEKNAEVYQSSQRLQALINHLDEVMDKVVDQLGQLV